MKLAAVVVPVLLSALLSMGCPAPAPGACPSSEPQNPAECPATWSGARALCDAAGGTSCSTPNLRCWYPGAGDCMECCATALLLCLSPDAGQGKWTCGQ
ncbi:MAG: hypothetical protein ACYC8T_05825 [Myxococcaceae bacterium]